MAELEFEEWAVLRGPSLKRVAFLVCGNESAADDLVQDTMVKLLMRWRRVPEAGAGLDAYARKVLVNLYISAWRRRRREDSYRHLLASPEAVHDGTALDDRSFLTEILAGLGRRQRAALVLRYYCDLDDAAIAEVLGCTEGTVRSQISRGLENLRLATPTSVPQPHVPRRNDAH